MPLPTTQPNQKKTTTTAHNAQEGKVTDESPTYMSPFHDEFKTSGYLLELKLSDGSTVYLREASYGQTFIEGIEQTTHSDPPKFIDAQVKRTTTFYNIQHVVWMRQIESNES